MPVARKPERAAMSERIQVVLPSKLAARVRARVPVRERSSFIAAAVANAIDREEQMERQQLEPDGAIWSDEDYPYLNTVDDIRDWREAIWSGQDPHQVLRQKYAKLGVVSKRDFRTWLKAWRATADARKAFQAVRASKKASETNRAVSKRHA